MCFLKTVFISEKSLPRVEILNIIQWESLDLLAIYTSPTMLGISWQSKPSEITY